MNRRSRIPKPLRHLFWWLFALLLAWSGMILSGLLPRIDAKQRAALDLLRAPYERARGEHNAFELLWLLPRNVPETERDSVFAADMAALDALAATGVEPVLASARYPRHVEDSSPQLGACGRKPGCLAAVRADAGGVRAALAERAPLLAGLDQVWTYDHLRTPHRPSFAAPLPQYQQGANLQLARAALRQVDGDPVGALTGLCRDLSGWRRLKGRSDSLVFEMVLLSWLQGGVQLAADLRAETPPGTPLPAECAAALAPIAEIERMSCDVYRAEFQGMADLMEPQRMFASGSRPSLLDRARVLGARFVYSPGATRALYATHLARACAALAAPPAAAPMSPPACDLEGRVFNPLGCTLAEIGMADYDRYRLREHDVDALLATFALGEWLVTEPDAAAALASRPQRFTALPVTLAADGHGLRLARREPVRDDPPELALPLPGSRVAAIVAPEPAP
ncbi:MAG: hypothetical protein IPG63_03755 [Xanthomonadales bacterium]|nr:hypothetical protein [Xanthomonadales bacterium]MBK7146475.1 hypothetical protein [Xanthomonadales bacterium]